MFSDEEELRSSVSRPSPRRAGSIRPSSQDALASQRVTLTFVEGDVLVRRRAIDLGSGERLEFTDAFGEWKRSGDLTAATAAIEGLARPGAVTTPGFTVMARFNFGIKEDVPKLAPGLTLAAVHADENGFETLTTERLKALGLTFEQVAAQLAPSLFETEMPNPEVQLSEA